MVTPFQQYLTEEKEEKNIHLEHLEDLVLNKGIYGVGDCIDFLTSLTNMLNGHSKVGMNITTKWDGAPSVVVGINPENHKFFVGTKSVFSKTPKINYTESDIEQNHESPELRDKLKICLRYLPKLGIKGILQGDILFTEGDVVEKDIDGVSYTTFTPNTITYAIPNSPLSQRIKVAKLGIVFHTEYSGSSISSLRASYHVDLGYLHHVKEVWFRDASFVDESGTATFTDEETKLMMGIIEEARRVFSSINSKVLQQIALNDTYRDLIKMYNNSVIRNGASIKNTIIHTNELVRWVDDRLSAKIREAKKPETQRKRTQEKTNILGFFHLHNQELKLIFDLQNIIVSGKMIILHKLSQVESTKNFIQTESGYKVTRPEGFVAIDRLGNAVKLVDRLEFSKYNFQLPKKWNK
jgi:hypothetical protein